MARCSCNGQTCGCVITAGENVSVSGAGTAANPLVISAAISGEGGTGGVVQTGDVKMVAYSSTPPGWLVCQGQAVSRSTYADLFGAIGTLYGAGDGVTTFNVPDLRNTFPIGVSPTRPLSSAGGSEETTLVAGNLPPHNHAINHDHPEFSTGNGGAHKHLLDLSNEDGTNNARLRRGGAHVADSNEPVESTGTHTHTVNVPPYSGSSGTGPGSSAPFSNVPPYLALRFLIKT